MIDAHEGIPGTIHHEFADDLAIGAFHNPSLNDPERETAAAREFINIYGAAGKTNVKFCENVPYARWRKLIFNAVLNPLCAILGMDDSRIRLSGSVVEGLVRPAMKEVLETARRLGHDLDEGIMDEMIHCDPLDLYLKPSMQVDWEKVSLRANPWSFAEVTDEREGELYRVRVLGW